MNKKIRGILLGGIKGLLVITIAISCWMILTPYFRVNRNKEGDYFRNIPENTIDVIGLGSSHMQYAFNPATFYEETGFYAYNLGSSCQPLSMSIYMLKEALKTQHPSVVFVDLFRALDVSEETCYANGMYYNIIDEMSGKNRLDAASHAPKDVRTDYKYDLRMNHDEWKNINLKDLKSFFNNAKKAEGYNNNLGYIPLYPTDTLFTPLETYEVTEVKEVSEDVKKKIDELISICNAENIKLIFIKTPSIIGQDSANVLHAIWSYLDSRNIEYIDFIDKAEEIKWYIDMDGGYLHNNTWGAEIVTKYLANLVKENGYVINHHYNETYESILQVASKNTAEMLMYPKNVDIYRLLDEASKYPSVVIMNYTGYSNTSLQEYESNALQKLGMTKDFLNNPNGNYYAVIHDGQLVQESVEPFSLQLEGLNIDIQRDKVLINNQEYDKTGEMQMIFTNLEGTWVNDMNIDYASKWFWKNGCDGFTCE